MGIPVSGRNNFPSNIQGMPTWYTLRVSGDCFLGRKEKVDILVAMNSASIEHDIQQLTTGSVVLFDKKINLPKIAEGITAYEMPIEELIKKAEIKPQIAAYLANMVYVGFLAYILEISIEVIEDCIHQHFQGKSSAIEPNVKVLQIAHQWAKENIKKKDPYVLKPLEKTTRMILTDGNSAAALGALYGGLQFMAWYPITPATSLAETVNEYLPQLRVNPKTGKQTCAVVQAEDELAAIGMVVGAGWGGLRAMTSTSGPGLSLMTEYLGLAYYAEVPLVVWDVQRMGPSTGLPTHTAQGDLSFSYFIGHGDIDFIILIPRSVNECFEFGWRALNIAELAQTPVFVMSDLELGMNLWMTDAFTYPNEEVSRGKVLWENDLPKWEEKHNAKWGRYLDVDKDGIPYRTLPGNTHPGAAYFTRGTGHDEFANYSEEPVDWERGLNRVKRKFSTMLQYLPKPIQKIFDHAKEGMISYGSNCFAAEEARQILNNNGHPIDSMNIKSIPFHSEVEEFLKYHDKVYVAESNRDGQMAQILRMHYPEQAAKIFNLACNDGLSLTADWIRNQIEKVG